MEFFDYILLIGAVFVGGAIGLRFPQFQGRDLHLVLSFSGAYLLSITAVHLIPEAFASGESTPGLAILLGFFFQLMFEQLSRGVEHGHIHTRKGERLAIPVLLGLSLHALLEGTPLNLLHDVVHPGHQHNHLLTGLILHKLPAAFALSVLLASAGYKKRLVWFFLAIFAIMSPLGALAAEALIHPTLVPLLLGLVIGSLLHVSTTILFELDDQNTHRLSKAKTVAILIGICSALLITYF